MPAVTPSEARVLNFLRGQPPWPTPEMYLSEASSAIMAAVESVLIERPSDPIAAIAVQLSHQAAADEPFRFLLNPVVDRHRAAADIEQVTITFSAKSSRKPHFSDANIDEAWAAAKQRNPRLFDKSKFRLSRIDRRSDGCVHIHLGLTSYKEYMGTNRLPEEQRRALEEDGERLHGDRTAFLSNALGVETVLVTSDGQVVLLRRSAAVTGGHGLYNGPSGHPEPLAAKLEAFADESGSNENGVDDGWARRACANRAAAFELFDSVRQEIHEETNVPLASLSPPRMIGCMADSMGKPDLLFLTSTTLDAAGVRAAYAEGASEGWESDKLAFCALDEFTVEGAALRPKTAAAGLELTCVTRAAAVFFSANSLILRKSGT